jgi:hypothetical protein
MTCPKCRANVLEASLRCPSCGLSKPKARTVEATEKPSKWFGKVAAKRESAGRPTERSAKENHRTVNHKPAEPPSKTKRLALMLSISMMVALLGAGAYWFVWPLFLSDGPEPQTAALVLEKLRKMPSNQEGLTVDESVTRELERSRRVGNLVSYQGWTVRLAPGDKSKLIVVFSFDERNNTRQRAEWLADPVSSTFTPQTDLAAAVYKR